MQLFFEESKEREEASGSEVLDAYEIEKIKQLLEMDEDLNEVEPKSREAYEKYEEYDVRKRERIEQQLIEDGLEIIEEEASIEELHQQKDNETSKRVKSEKKRKKGKKSGKKREKPMSSKEALLVALLDMKVKKIRKLLKGAEVNIQIRFKGND